MKIFNALRTLTPKMDGLPRRLSDPFPRCDFEHISLSEDSPGFHPSSNSSRHLHLPRIGRTIIRHGAVSNSSTAIQARHSGLRQTALPGKWNVVENSRSTDMRILCPAARQRRHQEMKATEARIAGDHCRGCETADQDPWNISLSLKAFVAGAPAMRSAPVALPSSMSFREETACRQQNEAYL